MLLSLIPVRPKLLNIVIGIVVFLSSVPSFAQKIRCAAVEYNQQLLLDKHVPEEKEQFEQWLQKKIQLHRRKLQSNARIQSGPYRIPVVFHIIHNGEAVGNGTNIPTAQIISQMNVLNRDFTRTNDDRDNTPPEFALVAGSMDIEFVLAKRTPQGLPTTGIVRVRGNKTGWRIAEEHAAVKAHSYWPSEDYLNIWICNVTDTYLGLAQFPISDLPGLEAYQDGLASTDGAIFHYKAVGSSEDGAFILDPQYDRGRTATHEIGHFLGLRHIWGDDGVSCAGTDYVSDTPNQAGKSTNEPTHPKADACSEAIMFQNFLDYTDDSHMNLFTQEQVERMITVLENSPRRTSLLTSPGLLDPDQLPDNDIALRSIILPSVVSCDEKPEPRLVIQNLGGEIITSFKVTYTLNDATTATKSFTGVALGTEEEMEIELPSFALSTDENKYFFEILEPNGVADEDPSNNTLERSFIWNQEVRPLPLTETFQRALTNRWTFANPSPTGTQWQTMDVSSSNTALYFNAFNNTVINDEAWFVTPTLDFSQTSKAFLTYDWSYAKRAGKADRFTVLVSTDCGNTYTPIHDVTPSGSTVTSAWKPGAASDWTTERLSLNNVAGESSVRLAFVFTNGNGNNFYLDNINITVPDRFIVFPNPATDVVKIAFNLAAEDDVSVEIVDALGKQIDTQVVTAVKDNDVEFAIGTYPPGLYIIRVKTTHEQWAGKIIKK